MHDALNASMGEHGSLAKDYGRMIFCGGVLLLCAGNTTCAMCKDD